MSRSSRQNRPSIWAPEELPTDTQELGAYLTMCRDAASSMLIAAGTRFAVDRLGVAWDHLAVPERVEEVRLEVTRFQELSDRVGAAEALHQWLGDTYAEFAIALERERSALDDLRGADSATAQLWRRHHPSWYRDMKPQHADAFDGHMGRYRERLEGHLAALQSDTTSP